MLLVVNHMIFLKDLTFSSSQSGPQGRELRVTATGPAAASRAKGSGLSFLSEDMHNVILDALGLNALSVGVRGIEHSFGIVGALATFFDTDFLLGSTPVASG